MLKQFRISALALLLGALSGLGSCTKETADSLSPTAPATAATSHTDVRSLQQVFLEQHYAQKVAELLPQVIKNNHWKWQPAWQQAVQKDEAGSLATYVPLVPEQVEAPHAVKLFGTKKFLRFTPVDGQWKVSLVEYFGRAITEQAMSQSTQEFLATFTGQVYVQELTAGETTQSAFRKGAETPNSRNCRYQHSCTWYIYCPSGSSSPGEGGYYTTSSTEECGDAPRFYTLGCGYETQYQLVDSHVTGMECDPIPPTTLPPGEPNPGDPDPGPGPTIPPIDGDYYINTFWTSSVVSIASNFQTPGTIATSYARNSNFSQQWTIKPRGDGYYTITSVQSGLALSLASPEHGANVIQEPIPLGPPTFGPTLSQQWSLALIEQPNVYVIVNRATEACMQIDPTNDNEGAIINTDHFFNAPYSKQIWRLQLQ